MGLVGRRADAGKRLFISALLMVGDGLQERTGPLNREARVGDGHPRPGHDVRHLRVPQHGRAHHRVQERARGDHAELLRRRLRLRLGCVFGARVPLGPRHRAVVQERAETDAVEDGAGEVRGEDRGHPHPGRVEHRGDPRRLRGDRQAVPHREHVHGIEEREAARDRGERPERGEREGRGERGAGARGHRRGRARGRGGRLRGLRGELSRYLRGRRGARRDAEPSAKRRRCRHPQRGTSTLEAPGEAPEGARARFRRRGPRHDAVRRERGARQSDRGRHRVCARVCAPRHVRLLVSFPRGRSGKMASKRRQRLTVCRTLNGAVSPRAFFVVFGGKTHRSAQPL